MKQLKSKLKNALINPIEFDFSSYKQVLRLRPMHE